MLDEKQIKTLYVLYPYLITSLCGAVILIFLDIWLRRRAVPKSNLIWVYVSLLSWAVAIALELLDLKWLETKLQISSQDLKYIFSPVSSIFFTLTAFQLSRVKELFPDRELRYLRTTVVTIVIIVSTVSVSLLLKGYIQAGKYWDATASSIASLALALGVSYSFYKYNNRLLFWLTWIAFLFFIYRQFYLAHYETPINIQTDLVYILLFFMDSTLVIMLFIALAVAWGLSDTARLKFVGKPKNIKVISMSLDLRGSTQWANEKAEGDFDYVGNFIDDFLEWAWNRASAASKVRLNLIKFLGDGFLFVWEVQHDSVMDNANTIINLACDLRAEYQVWIKEEGFEKKYPWGVPAGIGVGVDVGPAIRLTSENGSNDYLGSPINHTAKLQDLARPQGVVIPTKVWTALDKNLRDKFSKKGILKIGHLNIPVRMTEEVGLQSAE